MTPVANYPLTYLKTLVRQRDSEKTLRQQILTLLDFFEYDIRTSAEMALFQHQGYARNHSRHRLETQELSPPEA